MSNDWVLSYLPPLAIDFLVFPRTLSENDQHKVMVSERVLTLAYYTNLVSTVVFASAAIYLAVAVGTTLGYVTALICEEIARENYKIFSSLSPIIEIARKALQSGYIERKEEVRQIRDTIIYFRDSLWISKICWIRNGMNQVVEKIPDI